MQICVPSVDCGVLSLNWRRSENRHPRIFASRVSSWQISHFQTFLKLTDYPLS